METGGIAERFRDKTILITGATGFLGKLLVEKILRVQPEVRKLYLLVRAPDAIAAEERVLTEVVGNGLFDVLREQYGAGFHSFIKEKIYALPGDVTHENFGLESYDILQLSQKVDIIVNGAATTNFMERYDVALATNTTGVVHLCQFAKQCDNLKMVLHVSTDTWGYGDQRNDGSHKQLVYFQAYMILRYKVPLEMMRAANVLLGGIYTKNYYELNRGYNILMTVAKLYAPYVFFKGWFDDTNLRKLWKATAMDQNDDASIFNFDPKCINWSSYLVNTHIPAAIKYANNQKTKARSA
ncbi:hypothetical protein OsI_15478 [Oryza sativa Indica Group]|uniref:Fatty acyl-CoA reductase n=1 Tax=Oryza sativa subsp. indica TaxID=39946 RepID=A2XS80_ORYSI|nr:hypothetical protein OsI_15478 [Oryza sativa Indica Group]